MNLFSGLKGAGLRQANIVSLTWPGRPEDWADVVDDPAPASTPDETQRINEVSS